MSVSSISASAPASQPPAQNSAFRNAFQQLTTAIGSGDLQTAQQAYATITNLQQQGSGQSNGPMAKLLSTLGQALSAGDLATAQSTLADFQKSHGKHHHHGAPPSTGAGAAPSTSATGSSNVLDVSA